MCCCREAAASSGWFFGCRFITVAVNCCSIFDISVTGRCMVLLISSVAVGNNLSLRVRLGV
jgi:hypothetical protein